MTADQTHSPTCVVCRRRLAAGESYLVRLRKGQPVAVHPAPVLPAPAEDRCGARARGL